jgi:glycosyltransferase involved in cell wall biosynthesis
VTRFLVVGNTFPWPDDSGTKMRLATAVRALCQLGAVDLFSLDDHEVARSAVLEVRRWGVDRVGTALWPPFRPTLVDRLRTFLAADVPIELRGRDFGPVRRAFEAWLGDHEYDAVWCTRATIFSVLVEDMHLPTILDIDDLEDEKIRQSLRSSERPPRWRRDWIRAAWRRRNARAWTSIQRASADRAHTALVCSDIDAERLGVPHVAVVPNSYRAVEPLVPGPVTREPVVVFQGNMTYPPNADAAVRLVTEIAPALWDRLPSARVRLVGLAAEDVRALHAPPRVVTTGRVESMSDELSNADLVVVPLRIGSGTRIKIIEAFAYGVPVVSTTVGSDGLDVQSGVHLLIADETVEFAQACVRLLADTDLRRRLTEAAHDLFRKSYEESIVQARVRAVARTVLGG